MTWSETWLLHLRLVRNKSKKYNPNSIAPCEFDANIPVERLDECIIR